MLIMLGRSLHPRARDFIFPVLTDVCTCAASVCVGVHTHQCLVTGLNLSRLAPHNQRGRAPVTKYTSIP